MNKSESRKVFRTGCRVVQSLVPARRMRQIFSSMLASFLILFLGPDAQAKKNTGDWRVVENLEPGAHVIVKAQHKYGCTVEGATEEEIVCWVHQRRSFQMVSIRIPRAEIREVRTLPNQAQDAWIGAGIGGAAGAVAAGIQSRAYPGVNAFFGGLAGAGAGALVGAMVPVFQFLIQRGKTIYKQ
jgi:hypothetical protein